MSTEWSENIIVADLADEPALSDELAAIIERAGGAEGSGEGVGGVPNIVLNLAEVSYVNSSNIGQLLVIRKRLSEAGRRLTLCSVNDEVWTVMMAAGLDKVFQFAPDPMTALASLHLDEAEA